MKILKGTYVVRKKHEPTWSDGKMNLTRPIAK